MQKKKECKKNEAEEQSGQTNEAEKESEQSEEGEKATGSSKKATILQKVLWSIEIFKK